MPTDKSRRLSADDWTDAALDAVAEDGLMGLAVEPLARRMGTTKGSFYWHFDRRESLLDAVLARWEQEGTEAVIEAVRDVPPGPARLQRLFEETARTTRASRVEHALMAEGDHPRIAPVLARVTARRVSASAELFASLGFSPDEAQRRGLLAYMCFLGHWQLRRVAPGELASSAGSTSMMETVLRALTAE